MGATCWSGAWQGVNWQQDCCQRSRYFMTNILGAIFHTHGCHVVSLLYHCTFIPPLLTGLS